MKAVGRYGAALAFGLVVVTGAPWLSWGSVRSTHVGSMHQDGWIRLFNGRDLSGWTPKITGYELGDNFGDTFRVEDGLLAVGYEAYDTFDGRFGHLFYDEALSHYRLRVEYRFVGEQCPGAPDWARRNSGIMIHGQAAETMGRDQEFPASIEVQLLGGDGEARRPTANVCTPGTRIVLDGALDERHCIESRSPTFHGDEWVTVEVEVRGDRSIRHIVEGVTVLEYTRPQLDDGTPLDRGTISLQSEGHPIQFRRVELRRLAE